MLFEILAKDDDPAPPASGWELSSFDGAASLGHRPAESSGDLVDAQNQLPCAEDQVETEALPFLGGGTLVSVGTSGASSS